MAARCQAHVSGLAPSTTLGALRVALDESAAAIGDGDTLLDVLMPLDKATGACRGFAFATLASPAALAAFVAALDGHPSPLADGGALTVAVAAPKKVAPAAARGGGAGGGSGGAGCGATDGSFRRPRGKSKPKHSHLSSKPGASKIPTMKSSSSNY
jgi:hypothetical protein